MSLGAFTFVLHSHLPYVRRAGSWPHGEEMVHEAMCDTYVPLLDALHDLAEEGCAYRLAIGVTPILAEQLADPAIQANFRAYIAETLERTTTAARKYDKQGRPALAKLARWYAERNESVLRSFEERYAGDLVGALRRLQDAGFVEIVGSAATHSFLPLLSRDSSVVAQLAVGLGAHQRHFGRAPACFWLPECGYRPAYYDLSAGAARFRPGLESQLERFGVRAFFADTRAIEGGEVDSLASGGSGDAGRHQGGDSGKSTAWPYLVSDSQVAVFGRDGLTSRQVWSASGGYPGHFSYREFHRKDAICGLRLWRVTGPGVDLADKAVYEPEVARADVRAHVEHFVSVLERHLDRDGAAPPIVVAPYDTELFGHWWFEGTEWLKGVLRRLAGHPAIDLTTPGAYLERYPPAERIALPESSWGAGGDARTWLNDQTKWMWPVIHRYERQMEELAAGFSGPAVVQAARELLLLQSSDWPFLISTGQAAAYGSERFRTHAARFDRLVEALQAGADAQAEAQTLAELDNPFPDLDARVFTP